ncbi:MAG TPA: hypothetical protein VLX28_10365 [Thermoanaerobaculia bacterium]|nr:hypothetical protein [Thermoanaerobaculia bacterium]
MRGELIAVGVSKVPGRFGAAAQGDVSRTGGRIVEALITPSTAKMLRSGTPGSAGVPPAS